MNNVPQKLRKSLTIDPEYRYCALRDYHECGGRITWEHALIFAGKQIQERWAIPPICASGQEVDYFQDAHTMDKKMNQWCALNRATDDELRSYSKAVDLLRVRARLNVIYGPYRPSLLPA